MNTSGHISAVSFALLLVACTARVQVEAPAPVPAPEAAPTTPSDDSAPEGVPAPDVKAPGNLPVMTRAELEAEDLARSACLDACEGEAACEQACHQSLPIRQVEVVPDPPHLE